MTSQSLLIPLVGEAKAYPVVRIQPTGQRATSLATVGWKYRRRYTLVNGTKEPLFNFPIALDLGLTNGLVAGSKALASGNDLRVWLQGVEVARALVNWNDATYSTLVWLHLITLGRDEALTVDVVYGNPAAGAPPTLVAGRNAPAFDFATGGANRSTNAKWVYDLATVGKGGWWLSGGTMQPQFSFNVPGAWQPASTRASQDDRRQEAYTLLAGNYRALFSARRARIGSLAMTQDRGADGVSIHHPGGIVSVRCDLKYVNQATSDADTTPIGQLVVIGRRVQGEDWVVFPSAAFATLQATETTIATTTYTPAGANPFYDLAFAVWPYDGMVVTATARDDRYVNGQWNSVLELNVNGSLVTQTATEGEVAIYELAEEIRSGGGGNKSALVAPYNAVRVGNVEQASGVGTPRAACKLNEQLVIDAGARSVAIWDASLATRIEAVPLPAVAAVEGVRNADGTQREQFAQEWLPLRPVINPIPNPSFAVDAQYQNLWVSAGVTATLTRTTATAVDGGAGDYAVTASTLAAGGYYGGFGPGADAAGATAASFPVGGSGTISFGIAIRRSTLNLVPALGIWFSADGGATYPPALSVSVPLNDLPVDTWERRLIAAPVPANATHYRVGVEVSSANVANALGHVYTDQWAANDAELALYDPSRGALTVSYAITPRYGYA
jgi:hypothetical protein